jgi:HEAT repeat protein
MSHRHGAERPETDVRETSGFFPQSDPVRDDDDAMNTLIEELRHGDRGQKWLAAEELGNYPKALDALLAALPEADIDQTVFLCKALAQIGDRRAIGPLLAKWSRAPRGAPGTRYVPDALAAIGDRSVVPHLVAPLKRCRFDYRLHVAHALGILGGPEAEKVLRDMAAADPFPAVRREAQRALERLDDMDQKDR